MSYTLVLEWMPGDLYMSAVTARCTAPTSSYSVVWLPPNKVYQITLYCGSTSLVSFLVGAFRGKAWSYMKKIPYIDYKAIPEFCTINEVCRLFEVSKRELQELCETYDVQPRRNEIGEYGFVSYDVRKLHNLAYHSSREDRREEPWA